MPFDRKELEKTAGLCRIALTEEEKDRFLKELEPLCTLAQELDPESAAEPFAERLPFVSRKDEVVPFKDLGALLENAPKKKDGFILFSFGKEVQDGSL